MMANSSTQLLQVCTRCRVRSLIRNLKIARSNSTFRPTRYPMTVVNPKVAGLDVFPNQIKNVRQAQRREFGALSPFKLQSSPIRLRRKRRLQASSAERELSQEDEEDVAEAPTQQQNLQLLEFLYAQKNINRDEWRQAVFVSLGVESDSAKIEDERFMEHRVRTLREAYGSEGAVPLDLFNESEVKIWERLFGCGSLRPLEKFELEETEQEEQEFGSRLLREGEGGLEEVEFEEEHEVPDGYRHINRTERSHDDGRDDVTNMDEGYEDVAEDRDFDDEPGMKTHPLTIANRFGTNPSSIQLAKSSIVDPISAMISDIPSVHITETAERVFGGVGLPYSTSNPQRGKLMQQKPIALDAYQSQMSPIEGDVYMTTIVPGTYASAMSVLTETRKRLGTTWAEQLVRKAQDGKLKILDAGGAGAGVLAVRELLRAEWERMHEHGDMDLPTDLVQADGRAGGPGVSPPLGSATVLTGSNALRRRVSRLLDDTTFIPRLPDYIHTEEAKLHGKFDIVIAPHTLWQLREDYLRKIHVQNLWSMLSSSGGVLLLLEKGVPRGFELIAGAREMLLDTRVATQGAEEGVQPLDRREIVREPGMIIAPCTNHTTCPMYQQKGMVRGRRDICSFAQRYHRPPFLQKIYGARGRNHEDVEFSYLSIMRGRDLREANSQGVEASERAFQGFEAAVSASEDHATDKATAAAVQPPSSLSLPRAVFPPLKRKGHVIIDVCTPAGTLERWTVPRSFSKQAFRDARKSAWGDLWAMGAKTRVPRNIKVGTAKSDLDVEGRVTSGESRKGRRVKGIRDKRDKKGTGNGRRKYQEEF